MDPDSYNPDTVDLTRDPDARSYWLQCFEESLGKFAQRAVESQNEHCAGKYTSFHGLYIEWFYVMAPCSQTISI